MRPYGFVIPSFTTIQDDPNAITAQDGFQLEARLGAEAKFDGGRPGLLGANLEIDLTPTPLLKDTYVYLHPLPFLRFDLGQFKVPYSVGYLASDTRRLLPATPASLSGSTNRDMGFMVTGTVPVHGKTVATVQAGAFNGEGPDRLQNVNQRFLYAVRGVITPFGAREKVFEGSDGNLYLGVGGAYLYNWIGDGDSSEEINQYAGEAQFAWRLISVQGEFLYGQHAYASAAVSDFNSSGWYGTVSSFIPARWCRKHLQLVARVGENEPDDQVVGDPTGQVLPKALEVTGGVDVYWLVPPRPFEDVKLQLAYSHLDELEGDQFLNDTFTAAASLRF